MSATSSVDPAVVPNVLNGRTTIGMMSFLASPTGMPGRDGNGGDCHNPPSGLASLVATADTLLSCIAGAPGWKPIQEPAVTRKAASTAAAAIRYRPAPWRDATGGRAIGMSSACAFDTAA